MPPMLTANISPGIDLSYISCVEVEAFLNIDDMAVVKGKERSTLSTPVCSRGIRPGALTKLGVYHTCWVNMGNGYERPCLPEQT